MIKCIIVDDEKLGREGLQQMLNLYCPHVDVSAVCKNVEEAKIAIKKQNPDLVFLDIHMPEKSGFELIQEAEIINYEVVFVTAHDQYAIEAFKFAAIDYLLKPVHPDRLQKAVLRVEDGIRKKNIAQHFQVVKSFLGQEDKRLSLPTNKGYSIRQLKDIIYCKALTNYTEFFFTDGKHLIVSTSLKIYEDLLQEHNFVRVHRSYLVNISHIVEYRKGKHPFVLLTDSHEIPVSTNRKEELLSRI